MKKKLGFTISLLVFYLFIVISIILLLVLTKKNSHISPIFFGISFIFYSTYEIIRFNEQKSKGAKNDIIGLLTSILFTLTGLIFIGGGITRSASNETILVITFNVGVLFIAIFKTIKILIVSFIQNDNKQRISALIWFTISLLSVLLLFTKDSSAIQTFSIIYAFVLLLLLTELVINNYQLIASTLKELKK